jgi:hypothetical protein
LVAFILWLSELEQLTKDSTHFSQLLSAFSGEKYLLWVRDGRILISLFKDAECELCSLLNELISEVAYL